MPNSPAQFKRIAIIGGGISGLAAAYRAHELDPTASVTLFEATDRLGGILRTVRQDGFLVEQSADSFITTVPAAVDLCRRIGFADQLIPTGSENRGAMVVARGKLQRVPAGFVLMSPRALWPVLRSPILSWRGKLRVACEGFVKARRPASSDNDGESVASFARRRLGREAFERLVQPLVGGIYTADPEKLSLAATLPRYLEMERKHGSMARAIRAMLKAESARRKAERHPHARPLPEGEGGNWQAVRGSEGESGARYSMFVAPRDGLSTLVDAIAARLPSDCPRLNSAVQRIERVSGQWSVVSGQSAPGSSEGSGQMELFDGVIVATSASATAKLLAGVDPSLAGELAAIEAAGSAIVALGYNRDQIAHPLDSFGFVVPAIERRRILSASFSSVKFPGRAPDGKVLIRVFLGGALQSEMLELSDDQLRRTAEEELRDLLGIRGGACLSLVFRWPASMPQYHLGHLDRIGRINRQLSQLPGLALAGNAYEGVGIGQCIHSGEEAAERVLAEFK
jgi:oxygen-dependent protoporphyrinogen oxidase